MQPPSLNRSTLTHQLARMFAGSDHRPLIAIHGVCTDPTPIELPGVGHFAVVPADSELALRQRLAEPSTHPLARTVFLVPWTHHLPLDIAGNFAHDGRVFRIDAEVRVARLFTAPFETIDPEVLGSRLTAWLLREPPATPLPSPGGRLTLQAMWGTWLRHEYGLDLEAWGPSALLAWAASNGHGPRLAAALAGDAATGVQDELTALLGRRFGEPAPAIFRAWLGERGTPLLGFAVLCETLVPKAAGDPAIHTWLSLKAEPFLGPGAANKQRLKLLQRLAELVAPSLGELGRNDQRVVLRAALAAADTLADEHVRAALIDSPRLLSSWAQRLTEFGSLLTDAAPQPTREHLDLALAARRRLEQHDRPRYSRDGRAAAELARAEAALRLLAWLVASDGRPIAATSERNQRSERLARWYIDEGAYLDSARQAARGSSADSFGAGVTAIVARVDELRRELDHQFATSLAEWPATGRIIPIARALDRVAVAFLQGRPARRLLMLLLPGMAWTQTLELLASLDEDASRWGPLAGSSPTTDAIPGPIVLATIPSISPISRSALLTGTRPDPGVLPGAGADARRLAAHVGLGRCTPAGPAPLFHRNALADSAGSEVLAQIRDPQTRFVAVILDPADAPLTDVARTPAWRARSIRPFFELLDAARESGRAVLLASDHGHVPADRLQPTGERGTRGGARWRPWTPDAVVHDHETRFELPRPSEDEPVHESPIWAPRGAQGVIAIHDEEHSHGPAGAATGEHGGVTLAELVTPTLLLGWEGMDDHHRDPELAIRAAMPPRWWHLQVDTPAVAEAKPPRSTRKTPSPQLDLVPSTPTSSAPTSYHPHTRRLLDSPIFAERTPDPKQRELVVRALEALLAHGASVDASSLARALSIPARRVGGFIVKASEALNVDGYAVLHFDPVAQRAELHVERLLQCFELT